MPYTDGGAVPAANTAVLLLLDDGSYEVATWDAEAGKWLTEYCFIDPLEVVYWKLIEPMPTKGTQ